jgi:endonuclease/exonuclease/phosphatase family metal-dependent hydrolase
MTAAIGRAGPPDVHVMTWNIRRRLARTWPPADRWEIRRPRLARALADAAPTVLGVQEALPDQLKAVLAALGDRYRSFGHGRSRTGGDEGVPLVWDDQRWECLRAEQYALSETPEVPGSRSWGTVFPRAAVQAVFADRATGTTCTVINTHLEAFSVRARRAQAAMIAARAAAAQHPVIVLGDLNGRVDGATGRALLGSGLRDAWTAAEERLTPEWGTLAGYRAPRTRGRRIDVVAVSSGIEVVRAAIGGSPIDDGWASDHLPVHALVRLPANRTP